MVFDGDRQATAYLGAFCRLEMSIMPDKLITSDPQVMMGKPVVAGTRITVELILEKLAAGETVEQIVAAHRRLTPQGVRAAIAFAAEVLRSDVSIRWSNLLVDAL